jgi:F-type H+-transporting ATPase subunit b
MLDINPILLVSTIVVFLALIAVLNSLLYKPLFMYMEKRDADIKKDLEEVGSNDSEIAAFLATAEKIANDGKLQAQAMRDKAISDAKALANSKIDTKRAELALEYAQFEETMAQERSSLMSALKGEMPNFQAAVTAKLQQI